MKEKIKSIIKIILIVILYIVSIVGMQIILSDLGKKITFLKNNPSICELISYLVSIIIIGLIFIKPLIKDIKSFKKKNIKTGYKNWAYGLICMAISNIYLNHFLGNLAANETANRELLLGNPIIYSIIMIILAPIIEELVFRLNIKERIKNKWIGCIFSAILFGGMHLLSSTSLIELLYIIPYGSLGFFLAKAVYETDNIYTSIICHMTHNAMAIILIFLGGV